jgi:vancomycin permeability regulator SanA
MRRHAQGELARTIAIANDLAGYSRLDVVLRVKRMFGRNKTGFDLNDEAAVTFGSV